MPGVHELLPFIVSGVVSGAVYGLAGTGLVLTYKTSGILNFGHGAVAAAAAYVFYWLHVDHGLPWPLAFALSVVVLGPLLGMLFELLARRLALASSAMKVVGTVGVILVVQGLARIKYGPDTLRLEQYLPHGTDKFTLGGVAITYGQLTVALVALVAVAALYSMFRLTRVGLVMRAVVDDPALIDLHGSNARATRRLAWVIGATFSALSGVLVAPLVGIDVVVLTYLVVQAFGAAAVGAFRSIPVTFVAGIGLGIAASVSTKYVVNLSWLSGLPVSLPFIILFIVLLVMPRRKLLPPTSIVARQPLSWRGPPRLRIAMGVVIVGLFALLPVIDSSKINFFTVGLAQAIMLLSLGLLVRTSGQISLAHAAFAGIGAVAFSQFHDLHIPWLLAVVLGALVVVPIAAILSIPAIRLSGLFLALATFGFGLTVEQLIYPLGIGFTTLSQGRQMPRPSGAVGDTSYYYVVLAFLVAVALAMVVIHQARFGRLLRAVDESSRALSVMGLNVQMTKVIVFCVSGFLAGLSGILYGASVHFAFSGDAYYTSFNSLMYLCLLALAPFVSPWYAIFGAVPWIVTAYVTSGDTTYWLNVIFGVFAVQVATGGTPVMPASLRAVLDRLFPRKVADPHSTRQPPPVERFPARGGLEVHHLDIRFGGLQAVSDVSFEAPLGRITGLIGPNGAGKTSTFDACSGLNRSVSGRIVLHGEDVTRLGAAARGRRGLGRTFQLPQICESMTVAENVGLGIEAGQAGSAVRSQLVGRRHERVRARAATEQMLELCGIAALAQAQAGQLSTGQRRLLELARCLIGPFDLLLLDEPSSGLDPDETADFGRILARVVAQRGCGIMLVEHDMSLVMSVCDYLYVMDFGKLLFEGTPKQAAGSDVVRGAYLGSDAVNEAGGTKADTTLEPAAAEETAR